MSLPANISSKVIELAERTLEIEEVILFGSRAKGTHRYNSDIDLALRWDRRPSAQFYLDLDELVGLYSLDVVDLPDCDNDLLIAEIERHGVVLFTRE